MTTARTPPAEPHRLEHVDRAHHVDLVRLARVAERAPHERLRGQVEHDLGPRLARRAARTAVAVAHVGRATVARPSPTRASSNSDGSRRHGVGEPGDLGAQRRAARAPASALEAGVAGDEHAPAAPERRRLRPDLPRRLARLPQRLELALARAACPSAARSRRAVQRQLAVAREAARAARAPTRWSSPVEVAADLGREHEEAAVDPAAVAVRLLGEAGHPRRPSSSSAPKRPGGCTAVTVASVPCARWKATSARDVDVGDAVAVGEAEVLVADVVAARAAGGRRSSSPRPCRRA